MIHIKIEGLGELIGEFKSNNWFEAEKMDAIVRKTAEPLVSIIKGRYAGEGHKKTGALVSSIMAFQRKKKGPRDSFYGYYVGPRYGNKSTASWGGNAAHLLEYGTAMRFSADLKKGGKTVEGKTYGAKVSPGQIKPPGFGVIRRSYASYSSVGIEFMKAQIMSLIIETAKRRGLAA